MNNGQETLPPIPGSDEETLKFNRMDPFYQVKPREIWDRNKIVREEPEEFKKCKHYFISKPGSAECKHCGFGLVGNFEVQDGKLFHQGKAIGI